MEVVGSGSCSIRDLPPSKRFKFASSYSGLTPRAALPAKKRGFSPLPETAAVSFCLPAKKRAYAPPAAEGAAPVCLPAKKRAYAPPVDAIAPACLPAKKRVGALQPPDGDASACVPTEKRVHALAPPPPPDAHASACVPTKKRAYALALPPPDMTVSPFIPAKKRVYAAPQLDASASVPVCLASNKRVLPPFIPPSPPPPTKSDGSNVAAAVRDSKVQESNKVAVAIRPKAAKIASDGKGEASMKAEMPMYRKEVRDQEPAKYGKGSSPKKAKCKKTSKTVEVLNKDDEAIKQEQRKRADGIALDDVKEEDDGDLKQPKPPVKVLNKEDGAVEQEQREAAEEVAQGVVEEEDDGVHCAVCGSTDGDPSDPIVFCDGCDLMVHASCYGNPLAQSIPDGDWFCSLCSAKAKKGKPASPSCCLCPARGGAMKRTTDGQWAHIACALLVPEVFFRDPDGRDGIDCSRVPGHRFTTECYICESSSGCALVCSQPKCGLGFHVSCGLDGGLCMEYREAKGGAVVAGFCREHTKLWEKQQLTGKYKIVSRGQEL